MRISNFKTDSNLETNGVWMDIGEGASLLIARAGGNNKNYRKAIQQKLKPYQRQVRAGTLSNELLEKITIEAIAETVLLDWKGIEDDNGDEIPYSSANALELLKIPDFRDLVAEMAGEMDTFRAHAIEEGKELLKNS